MSAAQQLINEYLREGRLSANRSKPIGAGAYGVVYASDVPGNVIKQATGYGSNMEKEGNLQAIAAELGIAPTIASIETFRGGVGDRIEMSDVRDNFEYRGDRARSFPTGTDAIRVNQQLGQLALKGVRLEDRHNGNIVYNKMTGRPMQMDFGIADTMDKGESAAWLAATTADGMHAAGLGDFGDILRATVFDYLEGGQVDEAMDLAKQGFSRLQKIKAPLKEEVQLFDRPEINYSDGIPF